MSIIGNLRKLFGASQPVDQAHTLPRASLEAGSFRGSLKNWMPQQVHLRSQQAFERDLAIARVDELYGNDGIAKSGVNAIATNGIGCGLTPQSIIPAKQLGLERGFGAGLREISAALSAALADPAARAILFSICSPGGQARGVKELADAIFAARAFKPCAAWVDGLCASAAYWLASACGRVYAGPSSEVGSIGVILRHMDKSGLNKECGLNFTYITAGSHKAIGNPESALSERDLAVLQARVDAIYDMFCQDVTNNHNATMAHIIIYI